MTDQISPPRVSVLGVRVSVLRVSQLLSLIEETILNRQRARLINVNIYGMNMAYGLPWFRTFLNQSEFVLCDGFGVKWGARLLGHQLPERFTPPDWLPPLAELACRQNFTFFLLGNRPGIAERATTHLQQSFPKLQVVGTHHGYFDKTLGHPSNEAVVQTIQVARPNILFVGFGMPQQERWVLENWDRLPVNIVVTVGALFDYIADETPRGPRWMTDHGLEWLSRLLIEPRRLWKRYVLGNPLFLWRIFKQRLGWLRFDD